MLETMLEILTVNKEHYNIFHEHDLYNFDEEENIIEVLKISNDNNFIIDLKLMVTNDGEIYTVDGILFGVNFWMRTYDDKGGDKIRKSLEMIKDIIKQQ